MRILGGVAALLLAGGSPTMALQEQNRDDVILELQKKIEELEKKVDEMSQAPAQEPTTGLETRLDEAIHQSPSEPLLEPTRLNFTAPGLESATFTGFFRWRGAWWGNFNSPFNGNEDDILTFDQRLDLGMDLRLTEKSSLYIEFHDQRIWGISDAAPVADNEEFSAVSLDVNDLYGSGWDMNLGRQKVEMGAERQIGEDEWLNTVTRFDGITTSSQMMKNTTLSIGAYRLFDGDNASLVEFQPGGAAAGADNNNTEYYMVYVENEEESYGNLDFYLFLLDADNGDSSVESRLFTYGARWQHGTDPIWWDVEAATNFGKFLGNRGNDYGFDRYAFTGRAGWRADNVQYLDGFYVGYDYATGGVDDTYIQQFPSLHGWFGIMDFASWSNVVQYVLGMKMVALDGNVDISYRWLEVENDNGAFFGYNTAGAAGGNNDIGQELDITYTVQCTEKSNMDAGFGYFFPGDAYTNAFNSNSNVVFAFMSYGIRF